MRKKDLIEFRSRIPRKSYHSPAKKRELEYRMLPKIMRQAQYRASCTK